MNVDSGDDSSANDRGLEQERTQTAELKSVERKYDNQTKRKPRNKVKSSLNRSEKKSLSSPKLKDADTTTTIVPEGIEYLIL